MHIRNHEEQYRSLVNAISKFPDTASMVAVRLDNNNKIVVLSPHGLNDLFNLVIRPSSNTKENRIRLQERCRQKKWLFKWPKLKVEKSVTI